ncbi:MAG TPA: hypothetical protein DCZ94_21745 [Lentisphaeria bacterium]|nr:MAG: hypothetical protein A2X48_19410 [Lentisphaerae bacterium GWF2_49_21]HBC89570.1 hypothetical protein [Lentisphaeria bacterium]
MGNTAREINQLVQGAAKKKKDLEKQKEAERKSEFLNTAVDDRKKLDEEIKKEKKDYSKLFIVILSAAALVCIIIMICQIVSINRQAARNPWKTVQISSGEIIKAKEFVTGILQLRTNASIDKYLAGDIPPPWKLRATKIIQELKGCNFKLDEVVQDDKNLGSEALFTAVCSSPSGEKITFYIYYINNEFKIMRAEKIQLKQEAPPTGKT